jgi:hypothetical protein
LLLIVRRYAITDSRPCVFHSHPAGLFRPPFAVPHGPQDQKTKLEAKSWIPAFAGMTACGVRTDGRFFRSERSDASASADRRSASLLPGVPLGRGEGAKEKPVGARARCPFSGLLLFGQAKRSDPAARRADGKTHGCVLGENRTDQSKATANGSRLSPG